MLLDYNFPTVGDRFTSDVGNNLVSPWLSGLWYRVSITFIYMSRGEPEDLDNVTEENVKDEQIEK